MGKKQPKNDSDERDGKGRFTKGNSSGFVAHPQNINRDGRPPRPSLTAALLRRLNADGNSSQASGRKVVDALIDATLKSALEGSFTHLKEIWNRLDGQGHSQPYPEDSVLPVDSQQHRESALRLYRLIIEDPLSTHRDRLAAQEGIISLLGLIEDNTTPEQAARAIQVAMSEMLDTTMTDSVDEEGEEDDKPAS